MTHLVLAVLLAAAPTPKPAPAPSAAAVVHIKNFAFVPATVKVRAGQAVRFINDDEEPHTVTAVSKSFDSGGLDTTDTWVHVFAAPGTYPYLCTIHPNMHGSVVVGAKEK